MDEVIALIRSFDLNKDNIGDYARQIRGLNVEGAIKTVVDNNCDILINNIFIILVDNEVITQITILVNNKCLRFDVFGDIEGCVFDRQFEKIPVRLADSPLAYYYIDMLYGATKVDNPSIEWLLGRKSTKSARN